MKMPRCTAACSQYNDQPGVSGLFAGVLSEIPPGYFREQRERAEAEPNQGGISFSAGVLSEKPPDISADDINGTEIIPGRVYQASPRAYFPKNPRIFPRMT